MCRACEVSSSRPVNVLVHAGKHGIPFESPSTPPNPTAPTDEQWDACTGSAAPLALLQQQYETPDATTGVATKFFFPEHQNKFDDELPASWRTQQFTYRHRLFSANHAPSPRSCSTDGTESSASNDLIHKCHERRELDCTKLPSIAQDHSGGNQSDAPQFDDADRGESGFSTDDWHDSWTGGDEHDDVADAWEREYDHADGKLRARKGWAKGLDLFR